MADEDMALNDLGEEENTLDESPTPEGEIEVPEASEEVPEPETEPAGEEKGTEAKTGESSKKKGENQRIRQLVKEKNQAKAEAQSLAEKVAALTAPIEPQAEQYQPQTQPQPDEPIVKPGEEIDAIELDKRLKDREAKIIQRADAIATLRGRQQDAMTRHNNEAIDVIKTYPELDPDDDNFDSELSDSVTASVEAHIRANPYQASVKEVVAKLMRPYKRAVAKEAGKVTENIAKQASETALRPTSVKSSDKKFEELSLEEMEEKLGTVY